MQVPGRSIFAILFLFLVVPAPFLSSQTVPDEAETYAQIVRVSLVEGDVRVLARQGGS